MTVKEQGDGDVILRIAVTCLLAALLVCLQRRIKAADVLHDSTLSKWSYVLY